jgi:P-type Mg2+ transporter
MVESHPGEMQHFWTRTPDDLCAELGCGRHGLSTQDAEIRLGRYGPNSDAVVKRASVFGAIARRLLEPLSLILLAAGIVSAITGDTIGGSIIVTILAFSIGLDTIQEGHAVKAAEILRRSVALKAEVKRDGAFCAVVVESVVPGDILRIKAGDIIPADAILLECKALTTGEAALTGEPYPVEKRPGVVTAATAGEASNALFRGSMAQTGEAIALVVSTGGATMFGAAASALAEDTAPSPFERDLRAFGLLTARMTVGWCWWW